MVREAKALVVSAWCRAHAGGTKKLRCGDIASGHYRAADPWFAIEDNIAVRRLSPNNRKIEADDPALAHLSGRLLQAMGCEQGQGYRFGRPQSEKTIEGLLENVTYAVGSRARLAG